jgi:hypothetical protein
MTMNRIKNLNFGTVRNPYFKTKTLKNRRKRETWVHLLMAERLLKESCIPLYIDLRHALRTSHILHKIGKIK